MYRTIKYLIPIAMVMILIHSTFEVATEERIVDGEWENNFSTFSVYAWMTLKYSDYVVESSLSIFSTFINSEYLTFCNAYDHLYHFLLKQL